jgi:RNA polymerase sigma-70 factor, ECF subfamily
MDLRNHSDQELVKRMAAGDEEAFTSLYRRLQPGVYRFALHMSGSGAVAEDVVQEVFMMLIREANNHNPARGSVRAWLYGVARNLVLQRLERDRRYVSGSEEPESLVAAGPRGAGEAGTLEHLMRNEAIEAVRAAVLALPPHYREVVVLCELNEMDYAEAAVALGCAVGTVRSRLHRARALLAERLRSSAESDLAAGTVNPAGCPV